MIDRLILLTCVVLANAALANAALTNGVLFFDQHQGTESCHELHSKESATAPARVCFRRPEDSTDKIDDKNRLLVDIELDAQEGWQLEAAYLWLGSNHTDIPTLGVTPAFDQYPFQTESLSNKLSFEVSLRNHLGLVCPDNNNNKEASSSFLASLGASASNRVTKEQVQLEYVNHQEDSGSLLDQLVSINLPCPKSEPTEVGSIKSVNNSNIYTQQHRREQGACPPYPSNIVLNLTEAFMIRAKVVLDLATVVNSEVSGPIEDLIEEQRKIYERFDGFSNGINDQALVAKTKDTQTCFATFQSVNCINPLGMY